MRRVASLLLCLGLAAFTSTASAQDNPLTWSGCSLTKQAFMNTVAKAYEAKRGYRILMSDEGATSGIRQTASGEYDIGGSSRRTVNNPIERRVRLHPVAWDAIVAVVHPDNPVDTLSYDNLKDVMTGRITNWKALGGADHPIAVFAREGKQSGIGQTARELLFGDADIDFHSTKVFSTSELLEHAIEQSKYGIALDGLSSAKRRNLKILSLDGVSPAVETIVKGSYKLFHPLYLVTSRQPLPQVKRFVVWVQSPAGQSVIESQGTVSLRQGSRLWKAYRSRMAQMTVNARMH